MSKEKICPRCELPKVVSDFSKSKTTKDGLQSACKECKKLDGSKWRNNNKEKDKKYRNINKEKLKNYYKNWYNYE